MAVSVGDAKVRLAVPKTGDAKKFQMTEAGTLEIPAGTMRLVIRPVKEGWQPVNLRSVALKPAM